MSGKTYRQNLRIAALLNAGQQVVLFDRDGGHRMSLSPEGGLIKTPLPPPPQGMVSIDEFSEALMLRIGQEEAADIAYGEQLLARLDKSNSHDQD